MRVGLDDGRRGWPSLEGESATWSGLCGVCGDVLLLEGVDRRLHGPCLLAEGESVPDSSLPSECRAGMACRAGSVHRDACWGRNDYRRG